MKSNQLKSYLSPLTLAGILLWFTFINSPAFALQSNTPIDSITLTGRFVSPCQIPAQVKIWRYNPGESMNTGFDMPVSNTGEFNYRLPLNGIRQFTLKVGDTRMDFLATPGQKTYNAEITCTGGEKGEKIEIRNSAENDAFIRIYYLAQNLNDSLKKLNGLNKSNFPTVKNLLIEYQREVKAIATAHPETYTARVLCPPEILPEATLASISALRENYINREALIDPQYYYTNFFGMNTLTTFFLLLDKNDTTFTGFSKALNIVSKNTEMAKQLEQMFYGNMFYQNKEQWLRGYISWSRANPGKMAANLVVKAQLKNLENCIAGSPFIDMELNDPSGKPRKLSETVNSAKLTLLIFYSPTCSHCMENLPKLVPIWNQYKDKGFKIYAVGFEGTNDEWNDFMRTKGTGEWTNVFTTNNGFVFGGPYKVGNTPSFILIDQHGKIITRFADIEYLKEEIPKYFAK